VAECSVVELRQYTLLPGQRDVLIELFEREFLEPQELAGMMLIGQFRVAADGDRFVWLRGFADMQTRAAALASFYNGPVWTAHRAAANATMIDSDNVLLLRPASEGSGFQMTLNAPFRSGSEPPTGRRYVASIRHYDKPVEPAIFEPLERKLNSLVAETGGRVVARLVTERGANNYPALPVREDANVFVIIAQFPTATNSGEYLAASSRLLESLESIELMPTARSRLS
jgi:NIPSNAP